MSKNERNALAELAEELGEISYDLRSDNFYRTRIGKAQRIVAELAKVRDSANLIGNAHPDLFESSDAVSRCRAIAEEGGAK